MNEVTAIAGRLKALRLIMGLSEEEMARTALRLLGERAGMRGKPPVRTVPLKVVVPPSLGVRESSGPAGEC